MAGFSSKTKTKIHSGRQFDTLGLKEVSLKLNMAHSSEEKERERMYEINSPLNSVWPIFNSRPACKGTSIFNSYYWHEHIQTSDWALCKWSGDRTNTEQDTVGYRCARYTFLANTHISLEIKKWIGLFTIYRWCHHVKTSKLLADYLA